MFSFKKKAKEEKAAPKAEPVSEIKETPSGIPENELEEFEEFKRQKKLLEIRRLLKKIDHTLLKQTATKADLKKLCDEAMEYGFYSVCVQPVHVREVCAYLGDSPVDVACVVGFPMGENLTETKVFETKKAIADGADEVDMVACISAVKNGNWAYVKKDIKKVVAAAKGRPVKVILETSLLTRDELVKGCQCAKDAGASFVKTSTGFFGGGATAEDVRLMKGGGQGRVLRQGVGRHQKRRTVQKHAGRGRRPRGNEFGRRDRKGPQRKIGKKDRFAAVFFCVKNFSVFRLKLLTI